MSGWVYMLRCADDSFYVGSTSYDDVGRRVDEHNDDKFDGYTHSRRPVVLVWCEWCGDLRNAHELERKIKGWSRAKKRALIERDWEKLKLLAKRPGARSPSTLAVVLSEPAPCFEAPLRGAPQHDAKARRRTLAPQDDALVHESNRHPEVAAQRPSKDDGEAPP